MQQLMKRSLFASILLLALIAIGLIINAESAKRAAGSFELAADFPRGALVYAQFRDLPTMLRQWEQSSLKERYLLSTNFQQLQSRHLALKLVSRWEEFNGATGFSIDTEVLSGIADNRAAIAVYDIGRLDLVMIAPLSQEKYAACLFFQRKEKFQEIQLPDGTIYYLHDVEADRGRQKQIIGFAHVKNRFVLATHEKLLLRAIANINGQAKKDRLKDEPSFQTLSKVMKPHFITVWVDQIRLNEDWYFRHYWIMQNVNDLKYIRAGIFDLELQDRRWVERREFLFDGKAGVTRAALTKQSLQRIEEIIPNDMPFVQLRALSGSRNAAVELVRVALFDGEVVRSKKEHRWNWRRYDDSDFKVGCDDEDYYGYSRYSYLSHRYNLMIDDPDDAEEWNEGEGDDSEIRLAGEERFAATLQSALQPARPIAAARIAQPRALEGPLFAEFRRAAIITLQNPALLNQQTLERAIGDLAASRLLITGESLHVEWSDRNKGGAQWREIQFPMLGRSVGYGVRGQELIVSDSPELLTKLIGEKQASSGGIPQTTSPIHELTRIRLNQREKAFDQIFSNLDRERVKEYWKTRKGDRGSLSQSEPSQEFFSGNIASLLDVASPVREIQIQRGFVSGRLREEILVVLK